MTDRIDHILANPEGSDRVLRVEWPRLRLGRNGVYGAFEPTMPKRERFVPRELPSEAFIIKKAAGHAVSLGESSSFSVAAR